VLFRSIIDGAELPRVPLDALRAGDFAHVPLLLGTARDEGALHTMSYDAVSRDELSWFLGDTFGASAVTPALAHLATRPTFKAALSAVVTHGIFRCNARRVARTLAGHGVPVFLYEWGHALDGPPAAHALGPTHSVDLFFLFGVPTAGIGPSPAEEPLVELVQAHWAAFFHTGVPGPAWPRYSAATDSHFVLDLPASAGAHLDAATCDFWDSLAP
jgi:para-nitrobenzyl esterase